MLSELDVNQNPAMTWKVRRHYTWGLDLAGQSGSTNSLEAAGGIGGLLAMRDPNDPADPNDPYGDFLYFYEANGNVGQLIDSAGNPQNPPVIAAKYEYDAYGNNLLNVNSAAQSGSYAAQNAIRFSTKYWDDETGFGYWGYRYYSARFGRWLARDPQEEFGGINLYCYTRNAPADLVDPFGLQDHPKSHVPGTFDLRWGPQGPDKKGIGSNFTLRYTMATEDIGCCDEICIIQMVETEALVDWGLDEVKPPHLDGTKKGKGREPGDASWPCLDTSRTSRSKAKVWVEIDDEPGYNLESKWLSRFSQSFEACAVCTKGACKGRIYGCYQFAHYLDKNTDQMKREREGYSHPPKPPSETFKRMLKDNKLDYQHGKCSHGE